MAAAAATADVLFVAAGPDDAGAIVRALRAAGYTQPIMGGDSFDSPADRRPRGTQAATSTTRRTRPSAWTREPRGAALRHAAFQLAYGRPPQNAFAGLGFDAVDLVASAVRRADSVQPAKVRDALLKTRRFPGVTGTLSYDGKDRVPRKKVTIVRVGWRPVVVAQFVPGSSRGPDAAPTRPRQPRRRSAPPPPASRQFRPKMARK